MAKPTDKCETEDMAALMERTSSDIGELANKIRAFCANKRRTLDEKREACRQIVMLASQSTKEMLDLSVDFPKPFREIAEHCSAFPCFFPAHIDHQQLIQKFLLDDLNLGKRHYLKLRGPAGRKTFSTKT